MPTASPEVRQSGASGAARQGVEQLYDQVETLQSELRTLTSKVGHLADKGLSRARDAVSETVQDAEQAVRSNPYSAVAIAVGVGFLLGVLLRR